MPSGESTPRRGANSALLIAHDWIEQVGGSEKVVDRFAEAYPGADLATLWSNAPDRYPGRQTHQSPLARTVLRSSKAAAIPLMSRMWRAFDARRYDRAVISTHSFAHHLGSGARQRHLERFVYVHSPARWIWARDLDPRGSAALARLLVPRLQRHDRRWLTEGNYASNSRYIADRVEAAWEVASTVIHPPVDTFAIRMVSDWSTQLTAQEAKLVNDLPADFILGASRFIDYKRVDLAIEFGETVDVPVVIAGGGPLDAVLRARADSATVPVKVVGLPSDALLRTLTQRAAVFVYPPVEDFGIMPVEAYALGTPCVVNDVGGAAEGALATGGGIPVSFIDRSGWGAAFDAAVALPSGFGERAAALFSNERFEAQVRAWVD